MRPSLSFTLLLSSLFSIFLSSASAGRIIKSDSLDPCQDDSKFTASLFDIRFTPDNGSLSVDLVAVSSIKGKFTVSFEIFAYGHKVISESINPCDKAMKDLDLGGLCDLTTGPFEMHGNFLDAAPDLAENIPGVYIPFLHFYLPIAKGSPVP